MDTACYWRKDAAAGNGISTAHQKVGLVHKVRGKHDDAALAVLADHVPRKAAAVRVPTGIKCKYQSRWQRLS